MAVPVPLMTLGGGARLLAEIFVTLLVFTVINACVTGVCVCVCSSKDSELGIWWLLVLW